MKALRCHAFVGVCTAISISAWGCNNENEGRDAGPAVDAAAPADAAAPEDTGVVAEDAAPLPDAAPAEDAGATEEGFSRFVSDLILNQTLETNEPLDLEDRTFTDTEEATQFDDLFPAQ